MAIPDVDELVRAWVRTRPRNRGDDDNPDEETDTWSSY